ncbi:isocitrate lyase/PEP mutase family protein [Sabulicella rubraurantiaca]|uniref:isocitrate lyase/PEP mutase family protein n=1 Tax=Sabulicella rubraurantiaca TaxID=2811429 RepID=UPI001A961F86|nr:isocitrate lyase/phosphoenolpyruvate mutase family protein [Sabulicella rubraurantiaca]
MSEGFERFRALHESGCFVMPNPWDGGSAVLMAREGFPALASTSAGIAWAMGRLDGLAAVSREEAIANAAMITRLTGLPVNGDLEDGFGPAPEDCIATVEAAIEAGLAGLGIEDTTANPEAPIHPFDAAVRRIEAAAKAAKGRIVLTGRTDNFLHGRNDLDDTIRRLQAFAEAGADVLYAPGLPDMDSIRAVVRAVSPKPVNVVIGPRSGLVPLSVLAEAGVRRVSIGGGNYRHAMGAVVAASRALMQGDLAVLNGVPTGAEISALLRR